VTLGLVPAVISPYVVRAMGMRQARRYMLSAEPFDAITACRLNVVHRLSQPDQLLAEDAPWPCGCVATAPRR
jgi:methylglutaconyl-CoA hydratase